MVDPMEEGDDTTIIPIIISIVVLGIIVFIGVFWKCRKKNANKYES